MTLGEMITQYRFDHGMSQKEFAARAGMSTAQICRLEKGINSKGASFSNPTVTTIQKCARAMNVPFDKLYNQLFDGDMTVQRMSRLEYDVMKAFRESDSAVQNVILDILHITRK